MRKQWGTPSLRDKHVTLGLSALPLLPGAA